MTTKTLFEVRYKIGADLTTRAYLTNDLDDAIRYGRTNLSQQPGGWWVERIDRTRVHTDQSGLA